MPMRLTLYLEIGDAMLPECRVGHCGVDEWGNTNSSDVAVLLAGCAVTEVRADRLVNLGDAVPRVACHQTVAPDTA